MYRFFYFTKVVLVAAVVLNSAHVFAGWRHHGRRAAYVAPAPTATAAVPQPRRQYSYSPGAADQGSVPVASTYDRRGYRSFSYVPNAPPGESYVGPFWSVRGAASKANFNYAPYRGFGAPPQ